MPTIGETVTDIYGYEAYPQTSKRTLQKEDAKKKQIHQSEKRDSLKTHINKQTMANFLFWVLAIGVIGFIVYKFVEMQKDSKGGNTGGGNTGGGGYTGGGGAGELPKDQIK